MVETCMGGSCPENERRPAVVPLSHVRRPGAGVTGIARRKRRPQRHCDGQEALCKFVCHNLSCVIHSQAELGIEAAFWDGKEETESRCLLYPTGVW